jgi:hypothetical protein
MKLKINKSLSNFEISEGLGKNANIIKYSELSKYNNIDDAFNNKKHLILLFETVKNYGHWCCLIKRGKKNIEFFDSYGIMPDEQLKYTVPVFRKENNMLLPHLTYLLLMCKYNVEYNNYKFQKGFTTCGRWVIVRCILSDIGIDDFAKLFLRKDSDKFITKLTNDI